MNSRVIIVGICPEGRVNDITQYHSPTPSSRQVKKKNNFMICDLHHQSRKIVFDGIRSKSAFSRENDCHNYTPQGICFRVHFIQISFIRNNHRENNTYHEHSSTKNQLSKSGMIIFNILLVFV